MASLSKRPFRLALLVLLGLVVAGVWSARTFIGWQLASADPGPVVVGPARVAVPTSLPARMAFGAEGDVSLVAGDLGYDAMALTLSLTPLAEALTGADASSTLDGLERALVADEPSARVTKRPFGAHPGFVAEGARQGGRSRFAVVVAGGVLVRLEVLLHDGAPGKWRAAAEAVVDSLALDDAIAPDGLWSAFSSRAWDACGGGDVDACLWTARSSWQRGRTDGARAALERGLERTGPIETLWEEAKASVPAAAIASGAASPSTTTPAGKRLSQAVELHRLLGDLALAEGKPADAVEIWRRSWRFDVGGRTAERMLTEVAALLEGAREKPAEAGDSANGFVVLARAAYERFGEEPRVALAAARVASSAGDFALAKTIAQRLYDGNEDPALRREIVRVPLSAPPSLEPLPCPKGAKPRRDTTAIGTVVEACVDRAGKRQGQGRTWFPSTGYLLEEVTFHDGEPGAPDRRYWENGELQRRSLVDAGGAVTVERFDPFGRVIPEE